MDYTEKTKYLQKLFTEYLGDCDCTPVGDGTFRLESYDEDLDASAINAVIDVIAKDDYNISGIQIEEIPHPKVFSFSFSDDQRGEKRCFDICGFDNKWRPAYTVWDENKGFVMCDALSIQEAIEKSDYSIKNTK